MSIDGHGRGPGDDLCDRTRGNGYGDGQGGWDGDGWGAGCGEGDGRGDGPKWGNGGDDIFYCQAEEAEP
jgi:hypothetical protein